jgi:hypothetical protein
MVRRRRTLLAFSGSTRVAGSIVNDSLLEVNVLDLQAQAFHQAQTAAIQQASHELVQPLHPAQYLVHHILGKHGRLVLAAFGAQGIDRGRQFNFQ